MQRKGHQTVNDCSMSQDRNNTGDLQSLAMCQVPRPFVLRLWLFGKSFVAGNRPQKIKKKINQTKKNSIKIQEYVGKIRDLRASKSSLWSCLWPAFPRQRWWCWKSHALSVRKWISILNYGCLLLPAVIATNRLTTYLRYWSMDFIVFRSCYCFYVDRNVPSTLSIMDVYKKEDISSKQKYIFIYQTRRVYKLSEKMPKNR